MDLEQSKMVSRTLITVMGSEFWVEIFTRANGKSFALTRYSPVDIIITDGLNAEDAYARHNVVLPLAVGSRISKSMTAGNEL